MVVCSECGAENEEGFFFCKACGMRLRPAGREGPALSQQESEDLGERVAKAVRETEKGDRRVSPWWTAIAVLPVAGVGGAALLLVLLWLFSLMGRTLEGGNDSFDIINLTILVFLVGRLILTAIFGFLFTILTFKMIDRLNRHVDREERLRAALMAFLRRAAVRKGGEQSVINELLRLSAFDGQAMVYEKKMAPMPWAFGMFIVWGLGSIALLVPYSILFADGFWFDEIWFALYLISSIFGYITQIIAPVLTAVLAAHWMRTLTAHEARWHEFANATLIAARKLGLDIGQAEPEPPPKDRSFVLYLVLTVMTLGFFAIYWLYVLIKDPNEHMRQQRKFEDRLMIAIGRT